MASVYHIVAIHVNINILGTRMEASFPLWTAVDRALKGSMAGERMNKSFGREVREKDMS
jgi:hypothetical protein